MNPVTPILAASVAHANAALQIAYGWLLPILIPVGLVVALIYYINSRPLRRQEAARFVLELMESALEQGVSIERQIVSLADSRDTAPGVRFHLLAAYIEKGHSLGAALERVPELLPPQLVAMLKVGETLGDYRRVLPACRLLLRDGTSQTRALVNYQVAFGFVLNPMLLILLPVMLTKIFPVFNDIASGMKLAPAGMLDMVEGIFPYLLVGQSVLLGVCYIGAIFLLGGTRFVSWLEAGARPVRTWADGLFLRVPWKRKRLQRDFSAMLGFLLDAGVSEEKALLLAASGTANVVFIRRADAAAARLREGAKLADAVHLLDDTGEFRWRLANGAQQRRGFFAALQGWQASLEAKAFAQEQAAGQAISTILVLLNSVSVVLVATGVFQFVSQLSGVALTNYGIK